MKVGEQQFSESDAVQWLEHLPDALIALDAAGCIVAANGAARNALGYGVELLMGRPLAALVPRRMRRIEGMALHEWLAYKAGDGEDAPLAISLLRASSTAEVEVHFDATVARDALGRLLLVMRAPHATAIARRTPDDQSSARLVFDSAPIGVMHFDQRGVVTACNERMVEILGSSKRAVIGLNMSSLPHQGIARAVRDATEGRRAVYEGEYRSVTGGRSAMVRVMFAPIIDGRGMVSGGVGIVEDTSERVAMQARLAQADRLASVGTLAAGVAHEINNPLAYVRTNLEYALKRVEGAAEHPFDGATLSRVAEALVHALDGASRVQVIVRDLKTFARGQDEVRTNASLTHAVQAAINLAMPMLRDRATVHVDLRETAPVWADEGRLSQVFLNLLLNAAQATAPGDPEGRPVRVTVYEREDGRVCGEVSDRGEGIGAETLPRIFEPFFTTQAVGEGTGLGLSICHGIVRSLGGEIHAESVIGVGSTFRVVLPRSERPDSEAPMSVSAPEANVRLRVLIIDDESLLARSIELQLCDRHEVAVASTGKEAKVLLSSGVPFDLVLCDMMMPDTSGIEMWEWVQRQQLAVVPRFAFMTGGSFTPKALQFLRENGVPCLEKPFTAEQLESVVEGSVERARKAVTQ